MGTGLYATANFVYNDSGYCNNSTAIRTIECCNKVHCINSGECRMYVRAYVHVRASRFQVGSLDGVPPRSISVALYRTIRASQGLVA